MYIIFKIQIILSILFSINAFANNKTNNLKKPKLLIGFYGRPNTKSLGILGKYNIDNLISKMRKKQEYFKNELDNQVDVQLAFHLIYGLATPVEGRRKTYMLSLADKRVMKYIHKAQEEDIKVFIDLQMGNNSPKEALKLVSKYLVYDNVHLALDPEFKIPKNRKYPPGRFIGHITAKQLNEAQEYINDFIISNNLNKKELIVHMFTQRMLRNKNEVKKFENIDLIYNIDGHGHPAGKVKAYNNIYTKEESNIAKSGFKVFYEKDTFIMSAKQLMGLENIGSRKIWTKPYYINYH